MSKKLVILVVILIFVVALSFLFYVPHKVSYDTSLNYGDSEKIELTDDCVKVTEKFVNSQIKSKVITDDMTKCCFFNSFGSVFLIVTGSAEAKEGYRVDIDALDLKTCSTSELKSVFSKSKITSTSWNFK